MQPMDRNKKTRVQIPTATPDQSLSVMELLAPPLPGQRLLSFDEIVDREPAYMTSILAGCVSDCLGRYPAELGGGSWRMGADAEDAVGASEPGPAPGPGDSGKLPEHLHSSDLPGPTAALYYCPLLWPHRVHPVAPLKPLPVPLPLLPNPPVPYYPALSPQLALPLPGYPAQGRYSGFAQWQYYTPRPRSRDTPTYCSVLPEERRTSDPRERSQFREGSKVRHKATGCRSRSFSQLDSEGVSVDRHALCVVSPLTGHGPTHHTPACRGLDGETHLPGCFPLSFLRPGSPV
ncbi:calpain-B-like isoform X5 [Anguilla rostrata]|uniref:calpain-B-like isoform X5 n=1 Tax=Anguilla rostrata TaxID=7938 RepID=UPI0030D42EB4